jgi:hypothetical protein
MNGVFTGQKIGIDTSQKVTYEWPIKSHQNHQLSGKCKLNHNVVLVCTYKNQKDDEVKVWHR